jgi:hypothetical protein
MVHPLNKRERSTHRNEHPGEQGMRVSVALDRENQPSQDARERIVRMRAHEAQRWEAGFR